MNLNERKEEDTIAYQIGMLLEMSPKESHAISLPLYRNYLEPELLKLEQMGALTEWQHDEIIQILFDVEMGGFKRNF